MRFSPVKAALALIIPLSGGLLFSAAPALAAPTAHPAEVSAADRPFSTFAVTAAGSKTVRPGGTLRLTMKGRNTGPYAADAWFATALLPAAADISKRVRFTSSVKDTACHVTKSGGHKVVVCLLNRTLAKSRDFKLSLDVRVKKNAKGTLKSGLYVLSYDVQTGMEDFSQEELDRVGIPNHLFGRTVKTKVIR